MSSETLIAARCLIGAEIERLERHEGEDGRTPGWVIEARAKLRYAWHEIDTELKKRE